MTKTKTALYDNHIKNNAKMISFGDFTLPAWYSSLKEEHNAVRNDAGIFDISHMGIVEITGDKREHFLEKILCGNVNAAPINKMVYSMVLNKSGGIKDDILFGKQEDKLIVIVNGGNRPKILKWMNDNNTDDATITEKNDTYSMIAIQGPKAVEKLNTITDINISEIPRFGIQFDNKNNLLFMRTGYTGEDGFEIISTHDKIQTLFDNALKANITPCGLGCRDTLRLEKGLPLYGQDLSEDINPFMTRYSWVVKLNSDFIGKEALLKLKDNQQNLKAVGVEMLERVIPRSHYSIEEGGEITSGTLSPTLDKPIALALINSKFATLGTTITVKVRNKPCKAKVVEVPFK